jgi:hypothetical protein
MARMRAGSTIEATSLYEEHFDTLVGIAREFDIGPHDAEVLAHAVMLSSLRRLEGVADPGRWLEAAMRLASSGYAAFRKAEEGPGPT